MDLVSRSFKEISDSLSKALEAIKEKKDIFDKASIAVAKASTDYQESISNAQFLRDELNKSLNDSMGAVDTHVRKSA